MLAVILASLAKLVVILKLGLRNISQKDSKSHIFKHIHSTATWLIGDNLKRTTKSFSSLPFTKVFAPFVFFCLCFYFFCLFVLFFFCVSLSSIIFIISTLIVGIFYCLNYTSLLIHPVQNTPWYVFGKNEWYRDISKFKQETSSEKSYRWF